jgi:hypothetical protein
LLHVWRPDEHCSEAAASDSLGQQLSMQQQHGLLLML